LRGAKTVSGAVVIVGTSSSGFQVNTTRKWSEVVNEVVEGEFSTEGREILVSILDGGSPVLLEVGGYGSGSESTVEEGAQFGSCLDYAAGSKGKFGDCSENVVERQAKEVGDVGGGMSKAQSLLVGIILLNRYVGGGMVNRQSKEWKVGGEDGYETGKLGAIISVGNPREMVVEFGDCSENVVERQAKEVGDVGGGMS